MKIDYPLTRSQLRINQDLIDYYHLEDIDQAVEELCRLNDKCPEQFSMPAEDLCPYYGVLWDSALVLLDFIQANIELFKNKKIIELGAGLALPSIYLHKYGMNVTTTDFHPNAQELFLKNCQLNQVKATFIQDDWTNTQIQDQFDLIIGSDILYEGRHAKDIADALLKLSHASSSLIILDPKRGQEQILIHALKDRNIKITTEEIKFRQHNYLLINAN
jgi:predicted nicotinamide N-methyase